MPLKLEYWALQTLALLLTAFLIPGLTVSGPLSALLTVFVLSIVNTYLWDAALFLSIPNELSWHALLLLGVNGALFWIIVKVLPGIAVRGFLPALAAPVVFTITSILIHRYGHQIDWSVVLSEIRALFMQLKGFIAAAPVEQSSSNLFTLATLTT